MEKSGRGAHQRECQLWILTEDGEVMDDRTRTTPERLTAVRAPRPLRPV